MKRNWKFALSLLTQIGTATVWSSAFRRSGVINPKNRLKAELRTMLVAYLTAAAKCTLTILLLAKWFALTVSAASFGEFNAVSINDANGNSRNANGVFHLSNTTANDGLVFVCQQFSGSGQISARIRRTAKTPKVGLMFRQNTNAASASAGMFLAGNNTIFERQISTNQPAIITTRTNETWEWLRVVREGDALSGFYSADGTNWTQISADTVAMPESILVGFAISGVGEADVEEIKMTSARLVSPSDKSCFIVPTNIIVEAKIVSSGDCIKRIEYFSDAKKIGETTNSPYALTWSNALAGEHLLMAKITDNTDAEFFTEPIQCEIRLPPTQAKFIGVDDVTRGNWKGKYGAEGFNIILHATNYPAYADVAPMGHKNFLVSFTTDLGSLQFTNGNMRIAAQWFTYTNMTIAISLRDGAWHQIAFYCQDWGSTVRVQTIEALDFETCAVLDTRRVADFSAGKYFVWDVRGRVNFRITRVDGGPSVVCGIFFDVSDKPREAR